ncbi:MAG: glycosyl hydrolase [Actinomycetota bacterium]
MRKRLPVLNFRNAGVVLSFTLIAGLLAPQIPAQARPGGKLVPSRGVLIGAYVDTDNQWTTESAANLEVKNFETTIGRRLRINHHYYGWTQQIPTGLEKTDISNGRIPLISWQGTNLNQINSGQYDTMIKARARALKALGRKVFLRWGWEMNGDWYAWDGSHNNSSGTTNGPAKYRAAWKRIWNLFRGQGVTNVVWVWSPNHASVPAASWNHWSKYYPGDTYVDWVGIDGYNFGNTRSWSKWTTFRSIFTPVYRTYASRKPIMIGETSTTEAGGDKAVWIAQARSVMKQYFPSVAALMWFHVPKEEDWRVNTSSRSLKTYRAMVADSYYTVGIPSTSR